MLLWWDEGKQEGKSNEKKMVSSKKRKNESLLSMKWNGKYKKGIK
jgi:hypothetical protein